MDLYTAERQLNDYLDRQAAKSGEARAGQYAANEETERERVRDARRTHAVRLVNAKAWVAYYGGLALASHDAAARYAEPFRKLRTGAYERLQAATAKRLQAIEAENAARAAYGDANFRVESGEGRIKEADREIRALRGER